MANLKQLAADLGVAKAVCFAGWISDTDSFYNALDINTLTSISETFPYALTEGARAGLPTISSKVGGVSYLIDHGSNGFLFPPGEDQALADHLLTLARDPDLRKTMGQRLYEKAKKEFSIEATVQRQLEIYDSILRYEKNGRDRWSSAAPMAGATPETTPSCWPFSQSFGPLIRISPSRFFPVIPWKPVRPTGSTPFTPSTSGKRSTISSGRSSSSTAAVPSCRMSLRTAPCGSICGPWQPPNTMDALSSCMAVASAPSETMETGARAARVMNRSVDSITLRDPDSLKELEVLGVTEPKIALSADTTVSLPPVPLISSTESWSLGASPPMETILALFSALGQVLRKRPKTLPLPQIMSMKPTASRQCSFPSSLGLDVAAAQRVIHWMNAPHYILTEPILPPKPSEFSPV